MDLIERYLQAIRFWLPRGREDDILTEIADDLRSQVDDRQAELGRSLTEDELVGLLKERGQPVLVASRYLPRQHLIGPALLPAYRFVLKLVILWILAPLYAFIVGPLEVSSAANPVTAVIATIWQFATSAVFTLGVVTLVFAIMDWRPHESTFKWDPRKLPRVRSLTARPVSPYQAIAEIVMAALMTTAWIWLRWIGGSVYEDGVRVTLAPVWQTLFWPILLAFAAGAPLGIVSLRRPAALRLRSAIRLAIDALMLAILAALLSAPKLVDVTSATFPAHIAEISRNTNAGLAGGVVLWAVFTAIDAITETVRLIRGNRRNVLKDAWRASAL